ncbi:tetratricopeptide repeat protein [Streptomyces sp. SID5910]|uniref:tetratricopeptide repeat protein n=1 Tax=Streptomyces sp. SID5910 TaxID=2690312 RepID=UPI00136ADD0D|nr:tetratricopeptide repeat protein [Streptomyces sp. SID5910]
MTARSREAQALYEQLRALEGRARAARHRYSRREVIQALAKPPYGRRVGNQRISDWVPAGDKEPKVPSDRSSDDVLALVRLWSSWAGESVNERHWRDLLEQAQPVRGMRAAPAGPGRPIGEFTDPFALEVHEAIDGDGASGLPLLPLYVERQHDRWLADVVDGVVAWSGGQPAGALAVLVGESSTGKTRACWEALKLLPPDWRLVVPLVPSPAEALIAALPGIAPRTVLWLDEIHRFLGGDRGEQAAAHLREVLNDPGRGPLLVLGTTWPGLWRALVKPRGDGDHGDPRAQTRALLTGRHHRTPDTFEDADLPELRHLAVADVRLREALEKGEPGRITQYLAGGRALVDRYETATALQRALIESAMDARRLGHDTPLPRVLLEASIRHYLSADQYDLVGDGDIDLALAELSEPARGTRGPLTPITHREPGRPRVHTDDIRLADYLDQHGRKERRTKAPPAGLWDALADHATRDSLTALAESARNRGHLRIALRLLVAAVEAGVPGAAVTVAQFLEDEGRPDEALTWCLPLAEAGDVAAMDWVAGLMEATRPDEAVAWHKKAAEAGGTHGWLYAGMLLRGAGEFQEAESCFRRAADAGVHGAHGELAQLLRQAGRTEEALVHLRQEAEESGGYAVVEAATLMRRRGDSGLTVLAWLLPRAAEELGTDDSGFVPWAEHALIGHLAMDAGLRTRLWSLVEEEGQDASARRDLTALLRLAEEYAKRDRPEKDTNTPEMLRRQGRLAEALALYGKEAEAGRRDAVAHVAALHEQLGRPSDALAWYQRAAEGGDREAIPQIARLMTAAVGPDETFDWLKSCADRRGEEGYPEQRDVVAELLRLAGRTDDALAWLRRVSRSGDPYARYQYAKLLEAAGRTEDAQRVRRYGWEPGGEMSKPWSAVDSVG